MQEKFDQNSITEQAKSHTYDLGSFSAMTHVSGLTVTIIQKIDIADLKHHTPKISISQRFLTAYSVLKIFNLLYGEKRSTQVVNGGYNPDS